MKFLSTALSVFFISASSGVAAESKWPVVYPICGTIQKSIEDRIKDCSTRPENSKTSRSGVTWNLVARYEAGPNAVVLTMYEIWRDGASGQLWGNRLGYSNSISNVYSYRQAMGEKFPDGNTLIVPICESEDGKIASGGINERKFGLPSEAEYQKAEADGIREVLLDFPTRWDGSVKDYFFYWTTDLTSHNDGYVRVYNGRNGSFAEFGRGGRISARCVGR